MCGIAGYWGKGDRAALEAMIAAMRHRGPDDEGYAISENVGLANCRLAIIDLAGGKQPMSSPDGSVAVSFNGEIFNYRELKEALLREGAVFQSGSDTEVILHGYERWGSNVFQKLRGMFGIAVHDRRKRELLLARDQVGKKPLYWYRGSRGVAFASELKSLLAHSAVERKLDLTAVAAYFLFDGVPTPASIVLGVSKVPPGTFLQITDDGVRETKFWEMPKPLEGAKADIGALDQLLQNAVERRLLLADVPVGVFLSGGLDSSAIAWYASRVVSKPIKTFAARFEEASFDESAKARAVASLIKSDHTEILVTERETLDLIPRLGSLVDEPIADPSIVPTFLLASATRKEVTVALSGDGADELFLGYQTFIAARLAGWLNHIPGAASLVAALARKFPISPRYMSLGFSLKRFARGLPHTPLEADMLWRGSFDPSTLARLMKSDIAAGVFSEAAREWGKNTRGLPFFDALSRLYFRQYLMDVVLVKVDRASMFASLEVRSPFLDLAVVEFLLSLPAREKAGIFGGKRLLKRLMGGRLPSDIVHQKKHGFALPVASWLRGELRQLILDVLSPQSLARAGLFNPEAVIAMRDAHLSGASDYRKELWSLLVFELWRRTFSNPASLSWK